MVKRTTANHKRTILAFHRPALSAGSSLLTQGQLAQLDCETDPGSEPVAVSLTSDCSTEAGCGSQWLENKTDSLFHKLGFVGREEK